MGVPLERKRGFGLHHLAAVGLLTSLGSCIAPSVLDESARVVETEVEREWRPAVAEDLSGLYGSIDIKGPAAAALSKLFYSFEPSGSYTGAALFSETPPRFETLSGTWELEGSEVALDGNEPAVLEAADGALRMTGAEGTVTFVRVATH
ncbi:hypothetical protein Poly30_13890 [Planctomycetes bacterium Poly30]|uniref:Lipocalin-like domain-containing protein n=1 Tax=Saltatorellus ferox TaxID=2528018 RepID=A0A518EP74_9BACT|nr:hypothetical protein Poly30_13890 [Planctomycetes bacterium Poly30]